MYAINDRWARQTRAHPTVHSRENMTTFNSALQTFSTRRESLIIRGEVHLLRLELDSVKIAVIGEFKAGKSTIINAMLGKEVLPTWTVECTAAITQDG